MLTQFIRLATIAVLLLPLTATAEPIKLKLAYFSSDRASTYRAGIKPFIDAVNAAAHGVIEIEPYTSGVLGRDVAQQSQMVLDGTADIAFVTPGISPKQFPDTAVIELPGLFRDSREATMVYTKLADANLLRGYAEFVVIGAFATEPESIHTRPSVRSLEDLKGKRIRANNPMEAAALARLGMKPVMMPIHKVAVAISAGEIDGAAMPPIALAQFGIGRVANHHYMLTISTAPLALLMNRKKFERLPKTAQDVINKYRGVWLAERYSDASEADTRKLINGLRSDARRTVVDPSPSDLLRAETAFQAIADEWVDQDPAHRALLNAAKTPSTTVGSAK